MIGLDTNVLLRHVLNDDARQCKSVDHLLEGLIADGDSCFIDDVVLCEVAWTLRAGYRLPRAVIAQVLDELLETATFVYEDRNLLREAVRAYRTGPADFADYLIGLRNARAGCDHTVTFDRALKAHPAFTLL